MAERRVRVVVTGRVQGVFYRASTVDRARELGVSGWVRNLPDGRVEAEFQGPGDAVEAAVDFARSGPPTASVTGAEVTGAEVTDVDPVDGETGFALR